MALLRQLQFSVDFFEGRNNEHAKLHTLNFGHLAVREIEDSDPTFAHLRKIAFYVADRTAHGLKLDKNSIKNYT
ncbi:immunity protein Tsi6 family protein [Pseudoalteromonas xiamenensis]|uniref:immunity protein Tsi6 family protein n=1 Tax=Pseudoalteromonas xiamenensis TaxID=882626 RepID=UPI00355B408B